MHLLIITIHIFTIFNNLLMAMILWIRKNNTLANKILGGIIIIPVFAFVNNLLVYLDKIYPVFILLYINASIGLLFGPALLYYFKLVLGKKPQFKIAHLIHLIPSLIGVIISVPLLFLNKAERVSRVASIRAGTDDLSNILSLALLLHILFYLSLSWKMQKKHFSDVQSFFTDLDHTRYMWVRKFILWLIILNILFITAYLIPTIYSPDLMKYADLIATPGLTFLIYLFIMITGFSNHAIFTDAQYEIYTKELIPFNQYVEETDVSKKYGTSALKEEVINSIELKLTELFKEQKPYLDKDLSITKLADLVGIGSHQLSQFINRKFDKSFFDFINSYRVEEAKVRLKNMQEGTLSVEGIGTECGFGSPSAFYRTFKKNTGFTPSQYIKQL